MHTVHGRQKLVWALITLAGGLLHFIVSSLLLVKVRHKNCISGGIKHLWWGRATQRTQTWVTYIEWGIQTFRSPSLITMPSPPAEAGSLTVPWKWLPRGGSGAPGRWLGKETGYSLPPAQALGFETNTSVSFDRQAEEALDGKWKVYEAEEGDELCLGVQADKGKSWVWPQTAPEGKRSRRWAAGRTHALLLSWGLRDEVNTPTGSLGPQSSASHVILTPLHRRSQSFRFSISHPYNTIHKQWKSFPGGSGSKESAWNAGDPGLIPGSGRLPWRRKWQPIPIFLPGEPHGQRSLVAIVHGVIESDTTEQLTLPLHFQSMKRRCCKWKKYDEHGADGSASTTPDLNSVTSWSTELAWQEPKDPGDA